MDNHDESTLVTAHLPCPDCGSSDALSEYSDGHTFCFACNAHHGGNRRPKNYDKVVAEHNNQQLPGGLRDGEFRELKARQLKLETCRDYGYMTGPGYQIAQYYDDAGNVVAQKLRHPDKTFAWVGEPKKAGFFGKQTAKGKSRKCLVVTEGEIDALTVAQVLAGIDDVVVVSVQNGAQSAAKTFKADLQWVESFDKVVLCFDNDEHGIEAAKECAALLTPGKTQIAELPLKDANDMLKAGRSSELLTAIRTAKVYRPDGLTMGEELIASVLEDDPEADAKYPWEGLNAISLGMRYGELVTVTAGIGTGKTTFLTELVYHLKMEGNKVGMLMLEESTKITARRLVGHYLNKPVQVSRVGIDKADLAKAATAVLGDNGVVLYDHQGETDLDNLFVKVRYMVHALGIRFVVIDNLSALVAGMDERDERRTIDKAMRAMWQLAQRENIVIFLAVHLKRIEGNKGHEDGVQTSLSHLRGSQSIASNSNLVIGIERDQQGDQRNESTIRVLKNRLTGETGKACTLSYNAETGRLREADASPFTPMAASAAQPNSDF